VKDFLANAPLVPKTIAHEAPYLVGRPLADDGNHQIAQQVLEAAQRIEPKSRIRGVPYGTDAATFSAAGVPSVVFGPGSIAQAHTADEWLDLEQFRMAIEILETFCRTTSA
jgi:acetylornithine deacetylase